MATESLFKEVAFYLLLMISSAIKCPENLPLDVAFVLPSTGSCYFFSNTPVTFNDTQNTCEGQSGGHIVFYESFDEQIAVETELTSHWSFSGRSYWLGLEITNSVWYWTIFKDSARILPDSISWTTGTAPVTSTPAIMEAGGAWKTATTTDYFYPVCEIDLTGSLNYDILPVGSETTKPGCPQGLPLKYKFVLPETNSCYFTEESSGSITDARAVCEGVEGGHLIYQETAAELGALKSKLALHLTDPSARYWLGLEWTGGNWLWINSLTGVNKNVAWFEWTTAPTTPLMYATCDYSVGTWENTDSGLYNIVCEIDYSPTESVPTATSTYDRRTMGVFQHTAIGLYAREIKSPKQSFIECAALCVSYIECRGICYDLETQCACSLLYDTSVTPSDIDCSNENCFIKLY